MMVYLNILHDTIQIHDIPRTTYTHEAVEKESQEIPLEVP